MSVAPDKIRNFCITPHQSARRSSGAGQVAHNI